MYVVTADQKSSRTRTDGVPELLRSLDAAQSDRPVGPLRDFERTAGDEVQALFADPAAVVHAVVHLLRLGDWWVGVGVGGVARPLPRTARAGRGPAYLAARQAVESAKSSSAGLCVVGSHDGTGGRTDDEGAGRAEAAAWLLAWLLARRTPEGWEVVDLMDRGARQVDVATKLGISPQAVSRRLRVAGWSEEQRGRALMTWLLARADGRPETVAAPDGGLDRGQGEELA
jgi:hypothetical protein